MSLSRKEWTMSNSDENPYKKKEKVWKEKKEKLNKVLEKFTLTIINLLFFFCKEVHLGLFFINLSKKNVFFHVLARKRQRDFWKHKYVLSRFMRVQKHAYFLILLEGLLGSKNLFYVTFEYLPQDQFEILICRLILPQACQ